MQSVRDYIAAGASTRDIPGRPRALRDAESERRLLAVAETPSRRSTVHWFVCDSADDLQSVRYRDRLLRPPPDNNNNNFRFDTAFQRYPAARQLC